MGTYSIKNQIAAKKLEITVEGTFQPKDAQDFINDFNKETKLLNSSQYELYFNCSKLDVSSQQMIPILQNCMELYKKYNFKKIIINTFGNAILKMQLKKVIDTTKIINTNLL